jgi:hypothetical protein
MARTEADFRIFGAAAAFPGDLAASWGACLVEPPAIGALRRHARGRLVRLGDLAPPKSGIPTRVVGYFCLEELTDPQAAASMGLRSQRDRQRLTVVRDGRGAIHLIERSALKPMIRRPRQLEGRIDVRMEDTGPWRMLYLSDDKAELEQKRWTHTLTYIRYGETQDFPAGENSRRAGGVPAERPQVRVRPVWFQVARIPTGSGRVCWLKGRGDTHYAPTLAAEILVPDNFLYSAPPPDLARPEAFAAVANLSWTHLMAETYGRRAGGDGVLQTYIRELSMMPVIDPRKFTGFQADDLCGLFEAIARRQVLPLAEEMQQPDRQAFDAWAMQYLFGDDADDAAQSVERALRDLVAERHQRTASGREQQRRAVRRTTFDPAPIAARVLIDQGQPPSILQMAEDLSTGPLDLVTIDIPPHEPGRAEIGSTLMDLGDVLVSGHRLLTAPSDVHSLAIVAVLTTNAGYTGSLQLPADPDRLQPLYAHWHGEWNKWRTSTEEAIRAIFPKPQHAQRRVLIARELENRIGLPRDTLQAE